MFYGEETEKKLVGDIEEVSIGISATSLLSALIHIADVKRYDLEEEVDINIKGYSAGRFAFKAMLDDEVEMATVSDPNVVAKSFERSDFKIFATIVDSADHVRALTRKDTGILSPVDMKGKKVATTIGTTAYFSMVTFFVFNDLSLDEIELINLKPSEMIDAIKNKEVDVIFTWEPNIMKAQDILGKEALVLPNDYGYTATFSLASKNKFVAENPEILEKTIKALIKAEEFVKTNKQESIEIISAAVGKDKQDIEILWDNYDFKISLSQALLVSLEDQARWEVSKNESMSSGNIPNYLDYFYTDALETIRQSTVTIIR